MWEAGILEAMLFGEKRNYPGISKNFIEAAGISHVLVISGLHISLLALAVAGILRRLGFPHAGLGDTFCWCAGGVRHPDRTAHHSGTGFTDVFVLQGARLLGRSYDLLSALAFAGILMLLDNPDPDIGWWVQTVFCAVIGVGWYVSEKNKIFRSIGEKEKERTEGKEEKGAVPDNTGKHKSRLVSVAFTLPVMLDTFIRCQWWGYCGTLWRFLTSGNHCFRGLGVVLARWNIFLGSLAGSPAYGMLQLYQEIGNISEKLPVGMDSGSTDKTGDCRVLSGDFSAGFSGKTADKKRKQWKIRKYFRNGTMQYVTSAFC